MGLQHAFAMVGGVITPPYVVMKFTVDGFPFSNVELQQYAIVAALITSGICTIINVARFEIPLTKKLFGRRLFIGSGLLSVMGTSFTFLPIFEIAISQMKFDGISGEDAFGKMLGTSMLCALLEVLFSLLKGSWIKRIFPPIVTAVTVTLIGVALTGTGMKYWGGGVVCEFMSTTVCHIKYMYPLLTSIVLSTTHVQSNRCRDDLERARTSCRLGWLRGGYG